MVLKDAVTRAGNEADEAKFEIGQSWAATFIMSLEQDGFVVVPKEATNGMLLKCELAWRERLRDKLSRNAIGEGGVQAPFIENWRVMIAARPVLDDE